MYITYHCQYCGKSFSDPVKCREHEEDDHIHTISILGDQFGGAWGTTFQGDDQGPATILSNCCLYGAFQRGSCAICTA